MTYSKSVYVNEDRLDEGGSWKRSWLDVVDGQKLQFHSRAQRSWRGIQNRCKPGGNIQRHRSTYVGCVNGFKSFQEFAEWCQSEPGYRLMVDCGLQVHLDKDLIVPENKIYSPETCCFVPVRINQIMLFPSSIKLSGLPIGCSFHKVTKKYYSYIHRPGGGMRHLGYFDSPMEAHAKWQLEKAAVIRAAAAEMHPTLIRAYDALMRIANRLELYAANGKESKF